MAERTKESIAAIRFPSFFFFVVLSILLSDSEL